MIPTQQKRNRCIKVLVIPPFVLIITFVCVYSAYAVWYNPFTWFTGEEEAITSGHNTAIISPIRIIETGEYKVESKGGNESMYDVKFVPVQTEIGMGIEGNMQYRTDYQICLEADFNSNMIQIEGKNITYEVPPSIKYYKGITRQPDLAKITDGKINRFCTEALNPLIDRYIKIGEASIVVVPEDKAYFDGLLYNVVAEQGNFSHLNISSTSPYDKLNAYYPFDGDKNNTLLESVYDFTKMNNDGVLVGTAKVNGSGKYNNGLWLDGNSDYVSLDSNLNNFRNDDAGAISLWFKTSYTGNYQVLFSASDVADASSDLSLMIWNDGDVAIVVREAGSYYYAGRYNTAAWDGAWHHAVMFVNDSGNYLYTDGVQRTLDYTTGGVQTSKAWINDVNGLDTLRIGVRQDSGGNEFYFNGMIDDVMYFNTTLEGAITHDQIIAIYNNQSARFKPTGQQVIYNQTYMNISSGNNRVNVTTNFKNYSGSGVNLSIGYYDGSWSFTEAQQITPNIPSVFTISAASTNLTLNYTLIAGNPPNPFYTPIITGDILYEAFSVGGADTTPPSITLSQPASGASFTEAENYSMNITVTDATGIANCTIWHNASGTFHANQTNTTVITDNVQYNFTIGYNFSAGEYVWNAYCYDTASPPNSGFASSNNTLSVTAIAGDSCTCPASGVWEIINGDQCELSDTCETIDSLRIKDGGLTITSTGKLLADNGCYVNDNERLFIWNGGTIHCKS